MDNHSPIEPDLGFMNFVSFILFSFSLAFHKLSFMIVSYGWVYDFIYKIFALASVLMVITINWKKFSEIVKKRMKILRKK